MDLQLCQNRLSKGKLMKLPLIIFLIGIWFCNTALFSGAGCLAGPADTTTASGQEAALAARRPAATAHFTREAPAALTSTLTWTKVKGAVLYELELWTLAEWQAEGRPFFTTREVYINGYNLNLPESFTGNKFYWRVRALDLDKNPSSAFSRLEPVYLDRQKQEPLSPLPTAVFNQGKTSSLLYPVYAWIPVNGAASYELELLDAPPENPRGTRPSSHRIAAFLCDSAEYYDELPRFGGHPFYWRVRALQADGSPLGVYSEAGRFALDPRQNYRIATYGDSITHGGGHLSYSPADWEYSYQTYLDFPTVNLARSGDTSHDLVTRFSQDVLPFKPQFLLILAGSNSLRDNTSALSVILDLFALQVKCRLNHIEPVLLTLPPLNPANIKRAFQEPTSADWSSKIQLVNAYIRTQNHIDTARPLEGYGSELPTKLALDGLHLDIKGKKLMAAEINAAWPQITAVQLAKSRPAGIKHRPRLFNLDALPEQTEAEEPNLQPKILIGS
mgnify:CR=1 FL=1